MLKIIEVVTGPMYNFRALNNKSGVIAWTHGWHFRLLFLVTGISLWGFFFGFVFGGVFLFCFVLFLVFVIILLFRSAPTVYGSSQARGRIRATAAGLLAYTTATATTDPSHICNPHHSSRQHWILNPMSEAGDRTFILMDPSQVHYHWAMTGTPISLCFHLVPLYGMTLARGSRTGTGKVGCPLIAGHLPTTPWNHWTKQAQRACLIL